MKIRDIKQILDASNKLERGILPIVRKAVEVAGSTNRLHRMTDLPRQSISLWLRGGVRPSESSLRFLITWLEGQGVEDV